MEKLELILAAILLADPAMFTQRHKDYHQLICIEAFKLDK